MILHDFWRSSAAYRVRIALNLKGLDYRSIAHSLQKGEQKSQDYLALNPQGLVPALEVDQAVITQSIAIIEYLEENHRDPPLLPVASVARAAVRAMALSVACDIHPLNNLRVLNYLRSEFAADETAVNAWVRRWMHDGFSALEAQVRVASAQGQFCFGSTVTMADVCLVPQMYNARRFGCELQAFPTLVAIDAHCRSLEPFSRATPENQRDAVV